MYIFYYSPGKTVTVFLETIDSGGQRADSGTLPFVSRIIYPDFSLSAGLPQNMVQLDVGLYYFQFTLPQSGNATGSYLVDVTYVDPADSITKQTLYQVIVNTPFGTYSVGLT
jgi:hypothetical protein